MKIVATHVEWRKKHGTLTEKGWICRTTNAEIKATIIGRCLRSTIGPGQVVEVIHLHCVGCDANWKGPNYGEAISSDEVADI